MPLPSACGIVNKRFLKISDFKTKEEKLSKFNDLSLIYFAQI
jgi:hypothetical protein